MSSSVDSFFFYPFFVFLFLFLYSDIFVQYEVFLSQTLLINYRLSGKSNDTMKKIPNKVEQKLMRNIKKRIKKSEKRRRRREILNSLIQRGKLSTHLFDFVRDQQFYGNGHVAKSSSSQYTDDGDAADDADI